MIRVVTDSTCDLPQNFIERYNITVVPTNIQFGSETFQDGVDIDREAFYGKIEEMGIIPTSSQPSAGQFVEVYRHIADGVDTILSIHVTGKLSGTCQSAVIAQSAVSDLNLDIEVFDSQSVSAGLGFMVLEAARAAEAGKSKEEILQLLAGIRAQMRIYLTPATLKFLQMSGRVGKLQGALGSLLNVRPVIVMEDGLLEAKEKIRTRRKSLNRLLDLTEEAMGTTDPVRLAVAHAQVLDEAEELLERAKTRFNCVETFVCELCPTLVVHGGPGVIGIVSYKI
ncbi:MAG: DegV family protein [Anaerolineae bacterium]